MISSNATDHCIGRYLLKLNESSTPVDPMQSGTSTRTRRSPHHYYVGHPPAIPVAARQTRIEGFKLVVTSCLHYQVCISYRLPKAYKHSQSGV